MRTQEYVNQRLKEMKQLDTFGTKKEIKELQNILHDDEELLYITSGLWNGNTWLISCTNERLIFLDKGMIYGLKQKEIPLDHINSIEHSTGIMFGKIAVIDGASKILIEQIDKKTINPMLEIINKAINDFKSNMYRGNREVAATSTGDDLIEKLKQLGELHSQGVLTDEEFQKAKDKLLN